MWTTAAIRTTSASTSCTAGRDPAANRDPGLYRQARVAADPIIAPKLVVDTGRPLVACIADCLPYLAVPLGPPVARD